MAHKAIPCPADLYLIFLPVLEKFELCSLPVGWVITPYMHIEKTWFCTGAKFTDIRTSYRQSGDWTSRFHCDPSRYCLQVAIGAPKMKEREIFTSHMLSYGRKRNSETSCGHKMFKFALADIGYVLFMLFNISIHNSVLLLINFLKNETYRMTRTRRLRSTSSSWYNIEQWVVAVPK